MFAKLNHLRLLLAFVAIAVAFSVVYVRFSPHAFMRSVGGRAIPGTGSHDNNERPQHPGESTVGPRIYLSDPQPLAPALFGDGSALATLASGSANPLILASTDLDADGAEDLVVGYGSGQSGIVTIQHGDVNAFAPQSKESFDAISRGDFPSPFFPAAQAISLPINPDFISVGGFNQYGYRDLVVAARGGRSIYLLSNDGKGNFSEPRSIDVGGPVTALAVGDFGKSSAFSKVLVGVSDEGTSRLDVYEGALDGIGTRTTIELKAPAKSLVLDELGTNQARALFASNGKVFILHSSSMELERVSVASGVGAFALGSFVYDRNGGEQLALLGSDGSIDIASRRRFDPRVLTSDEMLATRRKTLRTETHFVPSPKSAAKGGWKVVEHIRTAASIAGGQEAIFLRTRISNSAADDLMVLSPATRQLAIVSHPDGRPGDATFRSAQISTREYVNSAVAAIPLRVNIDGRPGLVTLDRENTAPKVMMPLPDPTFVVNTTSDLVSANPNACLNAVAGQCSLRQAILEANATAGTDTITVPAGTFTLTLPRVASDFTGRHGTLEITDSVNIVGAGQATTIIQGGALADLSDSVDKVMSINEDISVVTSASVSLSNLTIQHGRNRGNVSIQDGWGGAFDFDTGAAGTATLTLTNVTLQNNAVFDGQGGGFAAFNVTHPGTGNVTVTNSIIQNNDSTPNANGVAGDGGGIFIDVHSQLIMSNSQVLTNHTHTGGPGPTKATGGGMFLQGQHTQPQSHFSNVTISGNTAAGVGGGINSIATLLIDGGSVISNNTAGANTANAGGGGIANNSSDGLTLTKVAVIGNSTTGDGGGLYTGNGSGGDPVTITFSRFAGNSSTHTPGSSNIFNVTAVSPFDLVTAQNNWWGADLPSSTIFNNGAAAISACPATGNNSVCFDPFIVLTNSATPAKIRINQSTTLTADMSKDNHGNGASLVGNLNEIVGLPITFNNPLLGTIPQAQPETLNASAQATATFNAGGTSGRGSANSTVDQGVVGANSNLVASATESGTTVTVTTVGAHNFAANETVVISGVGVAGYNGTFTILTTPTATTFTYTAAAGLGSSSGGTAKVGIIILEPPQITKSFGAARIPINGITTANFSINNPNVVAVNSSFTDTLPTGLQVAATPGVTNTCGGTVTATAGSASISFSNALTPIGVCTISVNVTGTVDNNYTNSVSILSTDAGNGNTSSASLTVINPPHIAKAFGTSPIVFGQTISLTFTIDSNSNQNLTITGVGFTDSLPAGIVVANPNGASTTCAGASVTAVAGTAAVTLAGASITPVSSCTVTVNITGVGIGTFTNSVTASSTNAGSGNTGSANITVNKADTTVAVGTSGSPSVFGESVTFTATISVTSPGSGTPTGTVTFKDNGVNIGTCAAQTAAAGVATCSISSLSVASHPITAVYNGDSNFNASPASPTLTQVVNKADTSVAVTTSGTPSVFGQSVTLTATISITSPGAGSPTGNVTFQDNGVNIGTCTAQTVSSSKATCVTSALSVGSHPITAVYNGDSNFNSSPASPIFTQVVNVAQTSVTLTSSQNPSVAGQSVTFTATISVTSPGSGTPTGTVTFQDNSVNIGTCASQTLTASVASCSVTFATAGSHPISATYNGDSNFAASSGNLTGNPQVVTDTSTWNGSLSSDWNTPGNWSANFVPTSADKVVIPSSGVTNQPNLSNADATIVSLALNTGTSLTISGNHTLIITSSLTMGGNNINDINGNLELGNGATISRTSGVILGNLKKDFQNGAIAEGADGVADTKTTDALQAVFTFPVGTASGFFPVDVTPTAGSTGSLTVQTFDGTAGVAPPLNGAKTLGRYWTLTDGAGITADVKFSYEPGTTINGTEANYKPQRVTAGVATSFADNCPAGPCVDETNHFIFMPGISTFAGNWTASGLAPTAAMVGVSGRVLSADGRGLRGVHVVLDDGTGHARVTISNAFGYYHFDEVQSGGTYLLNASARGYTFTPRVVSVNDELTDLDLTALP